MDRKVKGKRGGKERKDFLRKRKSGKTEKF